MLFKNSPVRDLSIKSKKFMELKVINIQTISSKNNSS